MIGIVFDPWLLERLCVAVSSFYLTRSKVLLTPWWSEQRRSSIAGPLREWEAPLLPQSVCKVKLPSINTKWGNSVLPYIPILFLVLRAQVSYFSHDRIPDRSISKNIYFVYSFSPLSTEGMTAGSDRSLWWRPLSVLVGQEAERQD